MAAIDVQVAQCEKRRLAMRDIGRSKFSGD